MDRGSVLWSLLLGYGEDMFLLSVVSATSRPRCSSLPQAPLSLDQEYWRGCHLLSQVTQKPLETLHDPAPEKVWQCSSCGSIWWTQGIVRTEHCLCLKSIILNNIFVSISEVNGPGFFFPTTSRFLNICFRKTSCNVPSRHKCMKLYLSFFGNCKNGKAYDLVLLRNFYTGNYKVLKK